MSRPPVRFGVIGLDHPHVIGMTHSLVQAGAELACIVPQDGPLAKGYLELHSGVSRARTVDEVLEDDSIELVVGAGIPDERADLGVRVMRAGKDYLVDKPGATTLDQLAALRAAQAETGRIFSVYFSERHENRATVRASELVAQGAIGRVVHSVGLGPHRLNPGQRPAWFFERERYGGILTDLASHQVEQFLHFTGATAARVAYSRVANVAHPEHPGLEDLGEMLLEAEGASGYVRVDWFTPDGLPTWGDVRLMLVGSEGTLEVRKQIDLAGREGADHLFWVDGERVRHEDCRATPLPFAGNLLRDVRERTGTAMSQAHCFLATELSLRAQRDAVVGRAAR